VYLIEEPMAAAIGVGLPVQDPAGNMIIDIGGGTTEGALISLSGVVFSRSVRVAGGELDAGILQYMKRAYTLVGGECRAQGVVIVGWWVLVSLVWQTRDGGNRFACPRC